MKKFKKALLSVLSLALVAILSIGATLAYLKDEDSDVNVMTMGNVKIAQHEYERAENEDGSYKTDTIDNQTSYVLKEFTQDKMLLPIVGDPSTGEAGWDNTIVRMTQVDSYGSMQVFAGKVAQDKFVTVENTGKNDAYIRTLVAIEVGNTNDDLIGISYHQTWTENGIGTFSANDTTYYLYEFVYNGGQLSDGSWRHENGVLPAGETSYPNLSQVYLKSETENEDVEAIDGNGNGRLDILVLSQAVQTSGFDNAKTALDRAFGEVTVANAVEWFGGIKMPNVFTEEQLRKALKEGGEVVLGADIEISNTRDYEDNRGNAYNIYLDGTPEVTLNLNGHTITQSDQTAALFAVKNTKMTFDGEGTIIFGYSLIAPSDNSVVTFENGSYLRNDVIDNDTANTMFLGMSTNNKVVINGGYFDAGVEDLGGYPDGQEYPFWITGKDQVAVIYGGQFVNWNPNSGNASPKRTYYFLEGQTEKGVTPTNYTIKTSKTSEGKTLYKVSYTA